MDRFLLDTTVDFLNHGSFGALPEAVAEERARWQREVERQPVALLGGRIFALLEEALGQIAPAFGARPEDLVFVPNATTGVAAVLASLRLGPGDEILTTDHRYGAVSNALRLTAARAGARVVEAPVPFPLGSADEVVAAVEAALGPRTRLLVVDQITSPTALIFPVERLARLARAAGARVLVDGAHAPGHLPLDLEALGADWWTGNLHKWAFAPRPTALLWARPELQAETRPAVVSHFDTFKEAFHWTGTFDPSPWLSAPAGLAAHARLGGAALMAANHEKVRAARRVIAETLGVELPHPDDAALYGAMATIPLPVREGAGDPVVAARLHDRLLALHRVEVPIIPWGGRTWVRVSGQAYNRPEQYERLARALATLLGAGAG